MVMKMWISLACLVIILQYADTKKERVEDQDVALSHLSEQLLHEIEKRLNELDKLNKCPHASAENSIIKTDSSIAAGARYLDSPSVTTEEECWSECCNSKSCDTAVFKAKGKEHSCYLFDCGAPSKCKFTWHDGFNVLEKVKKNHEDALKDLADATTTTTSSTTTTTTTTRPTTTTTTVTPKREPVPLFSKCDDGAQCAASNSECIGGYCVCQNGYHAQEGTCREDCSRFQFECANEGKPLAGPGCIAIYDKCDGTQHCPDASDEADCEKEKVEAAKQQQDDDASDENSQQHSNSDKSSIGHKVVKYPTSSGHEPKFEIKDDGDEIDSDDDDDDEKSHEVQQEEKVQNSNEDSETQEDKQGSEQDADDTQESKSQDTQSKITTSTAVVTQSAASSTSVSQNASQTVSTTASADNIAEVQVRVLEIRSYNRSAMVALTLGLAITILLALFVCCRCRQMQRQWRKGRHFNQNDADYLINGMYL